jgi:hypothetical protein
MMEDFVGNTYELNFSCSYNFPIIIKELTKKVIFDQKFVVKINFNLCLVKNILKLGLIFFKKFF